MHKAVARVSNCSYKPCILLVEGSVWNNDATGDKLMALLKWLVVAVAFVACALWMFPKILTGDYADITIGQIHIEPNGQVTLDYSAVSSGGTPLLSGFYVGKKYQGGGFDEGGGFLGRPRRSSSVVVILLNPESVPAADKAAAPSWPQRLLVHENEKKHLRAGERLYFYDFQAADGVRHDGYFEVGSGSQIARD